MCPNQVTGIRTTSKPAFFTPLNSACDAAALLHAVCDETPLLYASKSFPKFHPTDSFERNSRELTSLFIGSTAPLRSAKAIAVMPRQSVIIMQANRMLCFIPSVLHHQRSEEHTSELQSPDHRVC